MLYSNNYRLMDRFHCGLGLLGLGREIKEML